MLTARKTFLLVLGFADFEDVEYSGGDCLRRVVIELVQMVERSSKLVSVLQAFGRLTLPVLLPSLCVLQTVTAEEIFLAPNQSIQVAIDSASDGDVIVLQAGTYRGDLGFGGKNVTVRGVGSRTKLRGTGTGPVVSFNSGEGRDAVLDSVRVVGGRAEQGAGVYISGASPTIVRSVIFKNRAVESGSGIYVGANSSPLIANNVISRNRRTNNSGDPHAIQVEDGTPDIYNNTIIRNDSNGIFLTGSAAADIRNNIIAFNGHRRLNRGRGICDFSSASSTIQYNIFFRNIIGALLLGRDFDRISNAERTLNLSRIADNLDANPRVRSVVQGRLRRRSAAVNRGDPADSYLDSDGSRNDIGATGGPFAR